MFDFDAGKLVVIGVVALIVIGPKDLPRVMRQVGQAVAKLRRMAAEFQSQFMDAMREAELEDIRQDVAKLGEQANVQSTFNPLQMVRRELNDALTDRPPEAPGAPRLELAGLEHASEASVGEVSATATAPVAEPQTSTSPSTSAPSGDEHGAAPPEQVSASDEAPATDMEAANMEEDVQPAATRRVGGL